MKFKSHISYEQFTSQDEMLHPECDNDEYLDSVIIDLPRYYRTISFGYKLYDTEGTFIWMKKSRLIGIVIKE